MLSKMFIFEWRYFVRQPSFYVTSMVFFLLTFFATISDNVQILFFRSIGAAPMVEQW